MFDKTGCPLPLDLITQENRRLNENASSLLTKRNVLGIWYHDEDITDDEDLFFKVKTRLYQTFTYILIFHNVLEFTKYIEHLSIVENVFYIISGESAQNLRLMVENRPQCKGVYEYQPDLDNISSPAAFVDIDNLFKKINDDIKPYTLEEKSTAPSSEPVEDEKRRESTLPLSLGLLNSDVKENSFCYWTKESLEFFRFQALTRILTKMQFDRDGSLKEMLSECRQHYRGNPAVVTKIDSLKHDYQTDNAICYYTRDLFLFRMVGWAFRSESFELIFTFRRYIIDLHCELEKMHKNDAPSHITLYRGKKLLPIVIQQLKDNQGALVSMNGFLSTTKSEYIATTIYAGVGVNLPGYQSVLFELSIDDPIVSGPNADISSKSQFPLEEEVLFSFGSIWRIESVEKNDDLLWLVKLQSCKKLDSDLDQFFSKFPDDNNLLVVLGNALCELAQYIEAKNFYTRMLEEPCVTNEIRGIIKYEIAKINLKQGDYTSALGYLREAENLIPLPAMEIESTPSQPLYADNIFLTHLHIFNNMGIAYAGLKNDIASAYFKKALDIEGSDPIDKASVHDNMSMLLYNDGQYELALQHLEKAVRLAQDHSCLAKFKQHYDDVKKHLPQDEA